MSNKTKSCTQTDELINRRGQGLGEFWTVHDFISQGNPFTCRLSDVSLDLKRYVKVETTAIVLKFCQHQSKVSIHHIC